MFRSLLPAGFCAFLAGALQAGGSDAPKLDLPACTITGDANSCSRTLACIGEEGLWFDGQARGFNRGTLVGQRSDGVVCAGTWAYGALGTATANLECDDGLTGHVMYFTEDGRTGTGIARGIDSSGRIIKAWTGDKVLEFLGKTGEVTATLPCGEIAVPIL